MLKGIILKLVFVHHALFIWWKYFLRKCSFMHAQENFPLVEKFPIGEFSYRPLHCTAPHCTALHCTVLHCTACTAPQDTKQLKCNVDSSELLGSQWHCQTPRQHSQFQTQTQFTKHTQLTTLAFRAGTAKHLSLMDYDKS